MPKKDKQNAQPETPEKEPQAAAAEEKELPPEDKKEEAKAETFTVTREQMEKMEGLAKQLAEEHDQYLRLAAEFDNFRKRTLKEKSELIKNAAEGAMKDLLPVLDDFERAIQATSESNDVESIKEGVNLIYNKFVKYLEQKGVKAIESQDADFDTEYHEAVTTFPTDDESKKGKVIDTVQKGYVMNDKVIRHSKVVVGQ